MIFDIEKFYSSISKKLLDDFINLQIFQRTFKYYNVTFKYQRTNKKRRFQYYPTRKKITPLQQGNSLAKEKLKPF